MYKNQLQELAQRSCFNLPSYSCIREGPDHAPRFKATVIFNGETFESPAFCTTLRQAEHAAAEVALNALSKRGPSRSLAARVLDETGVYKNLLQETAHRAGLNLPVYTTIRSGPGHTPIFTCKVELAGMSFTGDPAKTKKQAQKNAAMAAWSALKQLPHLGAGLPSSSSSSQSETERSEEQEQVIVARALAKLHSSDGGNSNQQHDRQSGRRKRVPVWREANLADSAPFYSMMPCQGWVHSNFFPEISMYQTWHQENSPRLPRHYLTLPSPCPTEPINSAYMQPLLPSAQDQYFPVIEHSILNPLPSYVESPTMYFPAYPSGPSGRRSQVSIQEVPDEKNVLGEMEWFAGRISDSDGDPSSRNADISSSNADYKYGVSDQPLPIDNYGEQKASEFCDEQSNLRQHASETPLGCMASNILSFEAGADVSSSSAVGEPLTENMRGTTHLEIKRDDCEHVNCELRSRHPNTNHVSFFPQDTGIHDTAQSASITLHPPDTSSFGSLQGFRPLRTGCSSRTSIPVCRTAARSNECRPRGFSIAPPVTMRTAAPVCSARPGGNLNLPCLQSNVPAVRIRTVQPVCSDPAGRTTTSVQRQGRETEAFSTTASEFRKLQI